MNIEEYHTIIRRFCEQERFNADQLLREGILTLDGRRVALHFEPDISADHILVRAELGPLPENVQVGCFRSMLKANYEWGFDGAVLSLHPETEEAVLTARIPVNASTTAVELRGALDMLAGIPRHWTATLEDLDHLVSAL